MTARKGSYSKLCHYFACRLQRFGHFGHCPCSVSLHTETLCPSLHTFPCKEEPTPLRPTCIGNCHNRQQSLQSTGCSVHQSTSTEFFRQPQPATLRPSHFVARHVLTPYLPQLPLTFVQTHDVNDDSTKSTA